VHNGIEYASLDSGAIDSYVVDFRRIRNKTRELGAKRRIDLAIQSPNY